MQSSSPLRLTIAELVNALTIDDRSLATIADAIKAHSPMHAVWIGYERECRLHLTAAEKELKRVIGMKVGLFRQTAPSAAAVKNYAQYDACVDPDVVAAQDRVDFFKDHVRFCAEISSCISTRANLLSALSRLDSDAIVAHAREDTVSARVRVNAKKFNDLLDNLKKPWGKEYV